MKNIKKNVIFALSLASMVSFGAATITANAATVGGVENVTLTFAGAAVRTADATKGGYGLRFATRILPSVYDSLEALEANAEKSVTVDYGTLIVAKDKMTDGETFYDLNEANVWGEDAYYQILENGQTQENVAGGKVGIVNILSNKLSFVETVDGMEYYNILGSITDIDDANLTREYVGKGYIKYTVDGESTYYWVADYTAENVDTYSRSFAYVAVAARADTSDKAPTAEQKTWLKENVVDTLSKNKYGYKVVNHYLNTNGAEISSETEILGAHLEETVTVDTTADSSLIYVQNASEKLSDIVYPNGKTELHAYYTSLFEIGSVKLNDTTLNSKADLETVRNAVTTPANAAGGQKFYYMPNTKTRGDFTYTVKMSGMETDAMPGASIFTEKAKITFMVAGNQQDGKNIIVDVENNGTTWHDFVIETKLGITNKVDGDIDATLKIVKTARAIELYAPTANGEVKVLSMNADGSITLAEGATCSNSRLTDDTTKNGIKTFFKAGRDICCGLGTNNQNGATSYECSFEKSVFSTGSVTLNGVTLNSTANLSFNGSYTYTPTVGTTWKQKYYYLPQTKTKGDFVYSATMRANSRNDTTPGIAIFSDTHKISFLVSPGENAGNKIIVDVNGHSGAHDFVVDATALGMTNILNWTDNYIDVTLTIVKMSTAIELYAPTASGDVKVLSMNADGTIMLAEGVTCTNAKMTDNTTKAGIKSFFESGAEICSAISSHTQNMAVGYFVSFSKPETEYVAGSVALNGKTLNSSMALEYDGKYVTTPATTGGQKYYYFADMKTTNDFTYTVKMSGTGSDSALPGASIFTDTGKITFMVSDNEAKGKKIIVDVENNGTTWHDFVIDTTALNLVNVYEYGQSVDVTFKIVKTATAIELYAPTANGDVKVLSMNADGTITLAEGVTCTNAKMTDDTTKAGIKSFFEDGAEICCGLGTNSQTGVTDFLASFVENN